LVYAKGKDDKKFNALSSLRDLTYAPNLMYAVLIPADKLDRLKEWCQEIESACKSEGIQIQLRYYGGKIIHQVGND